MSKRSDAPGSATFPGQCTAHKKNGARCRQYAVPGGSVCPYHGGNAPHVRKAAHIRLMKSVDILMANLLEIANDKGKPDAVRLAAIRDALDRAGLAAKHSVEMTGDQTVRHIFDEGDFVVVERETDEQWEAITYRPEQKAVTGGEVIDAEIVEEPMTKRERAVFAEVEKQRERDARRAATGDEPGPGKTTAPVYGSEPRPGMNAQQRKSYERMLRERLDDDDKPRGRSVKFRRG